MILFQQDHLAGLAETLPSGKTSGRDAVEVDPRRYGLSGCIQSLPHHAPVAGIGRAVHQSGYGPACQVIDRQLPKLSSYYAIPRANAIFIILNKTINFDICL